MTSFYSPRHENGRSAAVLAPEHPSELGFYAQPLGPASPTRVREHTVATDLLILSVSGDLDALTAPLLERNLSQPLPVATVLDLSQVGFLGAAGLRVLAAAATAARAQHRRIGLVIGSAQVQRIVRLFDLDLRVPVYPAVTDAVRALT
ncbi:hypothetical protein GCM10027598_59870 [Amycolatopsis oliviviridis]|uniref:STAS domain-containing protein n=1 Tax=Amycolatopsis oliviviridis TaxID=1471590 RepID=A0ABQ3LXZ5_9PSEU|nr:STAS domain-containing protein [Amycolatopsis oliviviridis]GHH28914.1 hypothetical protein GCM10017790_60520 [Amycolatopsis oliviviridis]